MLRMACFSVYLARALSWRLHRKLASFLAQSHRTRHVRQARLQRQGRAANLEDSTTPAPPRRNSTLERRNSFSLPL